MRTWGYGTKHWNSAVKEGTEILATRAASRTNQTISYSELAGLICSAHFDAQDQAFHALLGDISVAEDAKGRGMLSVLVVHKTGDQMPGNGFFELAEELGRDTRDRVKFWAEEFSTVLKAHTSKPKR
jgi:hypothetical protein